MMNKTNIKNNAVDLSIDPLIINNNQHQPMVSNFPGDDFNMVNIYNLDQLLERDKLREKDGFPRK